MSEVGTLKELGVKVGDVVRNDVHRVKMNIESMDDRNARGFCVFDGEPTGINSFAHMPSDKNWRIISRANPEPREWQHLTDAEKGALLLAWQRGSTIEFHVGGGHWEEIFCEPHEWHNDAYRIKPEPKVESVTLDTFQHNLQWFGKPSDGRATHRITFNTIDGKPDCASVKMEEIQ